MVARIAQWLWRLQPDTLCLSPSATGYFPLSTFFVEQVELHQVFTSITHLLNYLELNIKFHDVIRLIDLDAQNRR